MKKYLLAFFGCFAWIASAHAYRVPVDRDNGIAGHVRDVSVSVHLATSPVPYLVGGGTVAVSGSSIAVYGVFTSTFGGSAPTRTNSPAFCELRATNTANTASELLVPPIHIGRFLSTGAQTLAGVAGLTDEPSANVFVIFDPPIVAGDHLSVNVSSNVGDLTLWRFSCSVFYRYLATGVQEDVWMPTDDFQGVKPDYSLYGVKVASGDLIGRAVNDSLGSEVLDFTAAQRVVTMASANVADVQPFLLYGWEVSSGAAAGHFELRDSSSAFVPAPNFLPVIYPRTLERDTYMLRDYTSFSFPWPVRANGGLRFIADDASSRWRLKLRPARALRR